MASHGNVNANGNANGNGANAMAWHTVALPLACLFSNYLSTVIRLYTTVLRVCDCECVRQSVSHCTAIGIAIEPLALATGTGIGVAAQSEETSRGLPYPFDVVWAFLAVCARERWQEGREGGAGWGGGGRGGVGGEGGSGGGGGGGKGGRGGGGGGWEEGGLQHFNNSISY